MLICLSNMQVILLLIHQWLEKAAEQRAGHSPRKLARSLPSNMSVPQVDGLSFRAQHQPRQSYQVINSTLLTGALDVRWLSML